MKYKYLICDLDGTILHTIISINAAVNKTMEIYGLPQHTVEETITFINFGSAELIRRALLPNVFEKEKFDEIHNVYNGYLHEYSATMNKVYDGIPEILSKIKEAGITLCILSNKPDHSAKECVEKYFDPSLFDTVKGSIPGILVKPQREFTLDVIASIGAKPEECILVGDSVVDCLSAQNASIPFIWVSWGYGNVKDFPKAPDYIANTPEEIYEILTQEN